MDTDRNGNSLGCAPGGIAEGGSRGASGICTNAWWVAVRPGFPRGAENHTRGACAPLSFRGFTRFEIRTAGGFIEYDQTRLAWIFANSLALFKNSGPAASRKGGAVVRVGFARTLGR